MSTTRCPLTLTVHASPTRQVIRPPEPPAPPGGWTWPPTASTLICGEHDAVLVDTPVTTDDAGKLADWVQARDRNLTTIYITHDHPDHWLGAPVLLDRFPAARVVALPAVVDDIRPRFASGELDSYWKPMFGGQIASEQQAPEGLPDGVITLEGHQLKAVQTGQSDTPHSTYLHIPELSAVVTGDIAYQDVHVNVASTDHAKRLAWIQTLRKIAALQPEIVVPGHLRPEAPHTADALGDTIAYIEDFDRLLAETAGPAELIEKMLAAHPARLNITTLYNAAYILATRPGAG